MPQRHGRPFPRTFPRTRLLKTLLVRLLLLAVTGGMHPSAALGQQGYEFGIRFRPIDFRPQTFRQFSFPGHVFRQRFGQPIQFKPITFPPFNSPPVRLPPARSRQRAPETVKLPWRRPGGVVASRLLADEGGRRRSERRLAFSPRSQPTAAGQGSVREAIQSTDSRRHPQELEPAPRRDAVRTAFVGDGRVRRTTAIPSRRLARRSQRTAPTLAASGYSAMDASLRLSRRRPEVGVPTSRLSAMRGRAPVRTSSLPAGSAPPRPSSRRTVPRAELRLSADDFGRVIR